MDKAHKPVLLDEVIHYAGLKDGGTYVDCTFGAGGYTRRMLEHANCRVIGFDVDPDARKFADIITKEFGDRFVFVQRNFAELEEGLSDIGEAQVDGIVFDLGVSSMQLDQAERGFSFGKLAALDMRMSKEGRSAMDFVNNMTEKEIADIIFRYGDESFSRKIAYNIIKARTNKKIETTLELAEIVRFSLPAKFKGHRTDPSTKTFQAIRIWVNDELDSLREGLLAAKNMLKNGGRMVVVTFHSGEDKIVKSFMNEHSGKVKAVSRYFPDPIVIKEKRNLDIITKKAIISSQEELDINPRARSAKLRAAAMVEGEE